LRSPPDSFPFVPPPPPASLLFPYTTLFRSVRAADAFLRLVGAGFAAAASFTGSGAFADDSVVPSVSVAIALLLIFYSFLTYYYRSEEHTSELQSHLNLVCRLLLEKKNTLHT